MDWVRLYHETPTDPKWRVIAKRAGQRIGDVIAVWNFVLCNASSNAVKRGVTRNLVTEDIAAALDLNDADVTAILAAMEGKVIKNGALQGWEKRNPIKEDHSTERVKRWRETQRNAEKRPELESDTEKETDKKQVTPRAEKARVVKPRTRIPENFPNEEAQRRAQAFWTEKGRLDLAHSVRDQAEQFRAHHTAHGKTMADWPAAWRTWVHNALQFNRMERSNGRSSAHDRGTEGAALFLARMEGSDTAGHRDRIGAPGDPLSAPRHGHEEMGGPVRDVQRGPTGQEPGGDQARLPALPPKP